MIQDSAVLPFRALQELLWLGVYANGFYRTRTQSGLVWRFSQLVCELPQAASINHRHRSGSNSHRLLCVLIPKHIVDSSIFPTLKSA